VWQHNIWLEKVCVVFVHTSILPQSNRVESVILAAEDTVWLLFVYFGRRFKCLRRKYCTLGQYTFTFMLMRGSVFLNEPIINFNSHNKGATLTNDSVQSRFGVYRYIFFYNIFLYIFRTICTSWKTCRCFKFTFEILRDIA